MNIEAGTEAADALETILMAAAAWAEYAEGYALENDSEAFANQAQRIDDALALLGQLSK